jgi:branched-chain amino acid transport system substrate-binding protein
VNGPLVLGAIFSRTGAGAPYGEQQVKGAQLAVELLGGPLELDARDDGSDPRRGAEVMRELAEAGAVAVLGPTLSAVARAAHLVADHLRVPALAVSNGAEGIVGELEWVWRSSLGEATAVPATIAAYVAEAHPHRAAVLHGGARDVFGADDGRIAVRAFDDLGVPVAADIELGEHATTAVRDALAQDPDVLFVATVSSTLTADVVREARAQGFEGTVLGGNDFNSKVTASLLGDAGVGARSGAAWFAGNDLPANEAFLTAYRGRWGEEPDQFAALAFTGVQILADAIGRAAPAVQVDDRRASIQRALADVTLMTPLGPFRFTPDHDVAQTVWLLRIGEGGRHELVASHDPAVTQ